MHKNAMWDHLLLREHGLKGFTVTKHGKVLDPDVASGYMMNLSEKSICTKRDDDGGKATIESRGIGQAGGHYGSGVAPLRPD